ncbi:MULTISPECIES: 1-phosphofructokinase [unclassified Pseudomonas]|jgi:1-phosphofructokinase|uniref:1-phosphofructokinase n=1 Tax=unclassified Pseudomonas TaxID=196821 RepID=UPI000B3FE343|nr:MULTISPECIES: 1-phosphofructokinase [unclassified Pseudomonas]AUO25602.1 1-phosphofructokinase [Pseudomonas sp. NC02]MBT1267902.1 1-phosphofructokinase [Pseudomonas sp. VS38]MDQ0670545.1 1-phosphofructokinase [Pseudomonas sp. W2I6]NVZ13814.1 1-phosphofructokinase [Pseudomonas sp. IPO3775]NVZ34355.1 1-phosphofructokinase [Pseudomonas sp. A4002]
MARILSLTLNPALDLTVRLARLEPGEVNRSEAMITHAAGKGVNVAQVLADLGHQVTVGGFLGEDNPQAFEMLIARRGFTDAFIRVPGETRSNIKIAEQDGRVTDVNAPGPLVSEQAQHALLEQLARIAPGYDAVVVAGSLPRGITPQWFQGLLQQLKNLGLKVALDTSGEALRAGLNAGPWLVKPNTEELADALGHSTDAIRQLHRQGVEHVVVSDGAAGVSWYSPDTALHATPPKVTVASTVGAGDSLLAGMLHGLLSGDTPEQTLGRATAIAAMAVTQIGFGITDEAQLETLQSGVHVRPLTEQ